MNNYSGITYKYLKVQRKRTVLTILGIILSVALITSIFTMIISLRDKMIQDAVRQTGDYYVNYKNVDPETAVRIKNHIEAKKTGITASVGFAAIAPVSGRERSGGEGIPPYRYLYIKEYDPEAFGMLQTVLSEGRLPNAPGEIIIDCSFLDNFPTRPKTGDRIKLDIGIRTMPNGAPLDSNAISGDEKFVKKTEKEYTIVGLIKPPMVAPGKYIANAAAFLDDSKLSADGKYDVYVKTASVINAKKSAEKIAMDAGVTNGGNGENTNIVYNDKVLRLSAQSMNGVLNQSMQMIVLFVVILVIISTIAVIYNAFHISVLERISQFGVLRCTGASPGQIRRIVLKEAAVLSIFGIPIGLVCGILAMEAVMAFIGTINFGMLNIFENFQVVVSPPVLALSSILGLVTVYLSAYGPARQASRVSPLEAVRNAGAYSKESFKKVKRKTIARHFFNIEGQMAFKNLGRNRKRFRITVFSMSISIVLYIVFGTFVNFFFSMGAVYRNVGVDYMISTPQGKNRSTFSQEQINEIWKLPGVEMVYKNQKTDITALIPEKRFNPRFAELQGVNTWKKEDGLVYASNSMLVSYGNESLADLRDYMKTGNADLGVMNDQNGAVLLATNSFYSGKTGKSVIIDAVSYSVGDEVQVAVNSDLANGRKSFTKLKIVGILDKGILGEEYVYKGGINLITTDEVYKRITGVSNPTDLAVRMKKGADKQAVANYFKAIRDKNPAYQYTDMDETDAEMRNIATVMSIFLYGFVGVIALIGCLNIINTISTNLLLRTRELSVLKAVGMTRGGIKRMVALEGLLYGLVAAFFGGTVGTVLSYLLHSIAIGIREVQWAVPWNQIITGILGILAITFIASYLPLKRINKGNIVENIRLEN